jgi:hypothetical protein
MFSYYNENACEFFMKKFRLQYVSQGRIKDGIYLTNKLTIFPKADVIHEYIKPTQILNTNSINIKLENGLKITYYRYSIYVYNKSDTIIIRFDEPYISIDSLCVLVLNNKSEVEVYDMQSKF